MFKDGGTNKWQIFRNSSNQFGIYDYTRNNNALLLNPNGDMYIAPGGGNVGIGTTSPAYALDISSNANQSVLQVSNSITDTSIILNNKSAAGHAWRIISSGTGSGDPAGSFGIQDLTVSITPLVITSSGNVGIGTTNPTAALQINGTLNATAIQTAAGQPFKIRYGSGSISVNSQGQGGINYGTISFGYTFSSPPVVTVTNNSFGNWLDALVPIAYGITNTGFTLFFTNMTTNTANGTLNYNWIAVGQ